MIQGRHRLRSAQREVDEKRAQAQSSTHIGRVARGRAHRRQVARLRQGARPLDADDVARGLHTVGRCAADLRHAFLGLAVAGERLDDVSLLRDYGHLERLDLSRNVLADLAPLARLAFLTDLDVSDNALTEALAFAAPLCAPGNAWTTGALNVGSQLRVADASRNKIAAVADLRRHARLEELRLDGNLLRRISGVAGLRRLAVLSLCGNKIERIDGLDDLPALRDLRLDGNAIRALENLGGLAALRRLSVAGNEIDSLDGLQGCLALGTLDASANRVANVREVEFLAALPLLVDVALCGNACDAVEFYRRRVALRLPRLSRLDGAPVTSEEKVQAVNLHGGDESDAGHRKDAHKKFFGADSPFEDTLPPFVETEPDPDAPEARQKRGIDRLVHRAVSA
ncbi:hypothetical protein M885DRAFT_544460 [Pelagophyceae sp. CCMP2097]|nr:hypothetical protein M885DRAFT_544460 [Pelagophyceae sp. CCMP2097]